ncbi:MAG: ABC transporter permease [Bacteroidota bacterium]
MFKHHLLIAVRNMRRTGSSTTINLLSLAVGLVCVILIYTWVYHQWQVDRNFEKSDRLYQVMENDPTPDGISTDAYTPGPLATTLAEDFPDVEHAVTVVPYDWFEGEKFVLTDGGQNKFIAKNQFASEDFFEVFSYELVQGEKSTVLTSNNAIAISEELAEKLFGQQAALGKTIEWVHESYGGLYTVSGVFTKSKQATSMEFDAVFSYEKFTEVHTNLTAWNNSDPSTFLTLKENTDADLFNTKIEKLAQSKQENISYTFYAQLLSDRYLYGRYENGRPVGGRIAYVRLFSLIAFFILIIACVNFMNMATAKALARTKEIGVKKAIGADRASLIKQYLTESVLLAFMSLILAIGVIFMVYPKFTAIAGLNAGFTFDPYLLSGILIITLLTGIVAGSYPALFLSAFRPVKALKGELNKSWTGQLTRKGLIVFQFIVSAILISSVIIINQQIKLIQNKNLGYNKDNTIWFSMGTKADGQASANELSPEDIAYFIQEVKKLPGVDNASNFAQHITGDYGGTTGLTWPGNPADNRILFATIAAGYDFVETMGIEMIAGRSYGKNYQADTASLIVNQAAIEAMGFEDPIGKKVNLWGKDRMIVGVTQNFHFDDLYKEIDPLFINLTKDNFASNIMVKLESGNEKATIERIRQLYNNYFVADIPFEFTFLDESYQQLYASEIRVGKLSTYFAGIAIFISCLGLFGFATFVVQRRLKEIAVRKVLGSSKFNIIKLLSGSFLSLIGIALLVGLPIGYWISKTWLDAFVYKIDIQWTYFVLAVFLITLLALLTVSVQTIRATGVNMVKFLKE